MDDKLTESRDLYGCQHLPHLFSGEVDQKQSEIRRRYLGIGMSLPVPDLNFWSLATPPTQGISPAALDKVQ